MIAFTDLEAQQARIRPQLLQRIEAVLLRGQYIMGPEVAQLEKELTAFSGSKYCVSCASGTDALWLVMMAKNIGRGDAVFVPSFTYAATAEAVALLGATPVFVDVLADSFTMDPQSLLQAIEAAKHLGLHPAAMIPVDLFGQAADYAKLLPIAKAHNIWVLCDAAQAFGARVGAQAVCTFGLATATSFFPSKPLGCYGDGGAIFTDDDELHALLCSLRVHGKGNGKYDNVRIGTNSRLDTLQAAILLEKLALFSEEIALRQLVAKRYTQFLEGRVGVPSISSGNSSVWAQYTIQLENADIRSRVQNALQAAGIPTMIYYPIPMHRQEGYRQFPTATGTTLPVSEALSQRVLSLPMHPYLRPEVQATITECLLKSLG